MENSYKVIEIPTAGAQFDQYKALVLATWIQSLRFENDFFQLIDKKTYFTVYSKVIMGILKRENARARLAVLVDDPDIVVGWTVFEGNCLHFIYVIRGGKGKESGRHQGIATAIYPKGVEVFTHITKIGKSIWKKKLKRLKFNPF
jgi:hypothetical protein